MSWGWLLVTCAGCYLLKLVGTAVPEQVLERPLVARAGALVPVALLAALAAVQALSTGEQLAVDARAAGLAAGVAALLLRAPFLVVVVVAAGTAAGLRALT